LPPRSSKQSTPFWKTSRWRSNLEGYLTIAPWLIGFLLFTAGPMVASAVLSFMRYDIVSPPRWLGLGNFERMLSDPRFFRSLRFTAEYSFMAVPVHLLSGFFFAMLLNRSLRGIGVFRTLYYLPSVTPSVANAALWMWLLEPQFGVANVILKALGLPTFRFLFDGNTVRPTMALMGLWYVGQQMVIFLAALQGVPEEMYEAASIDGASSWRKLIQITLPMISPAILFNLTMGLINSFQVFNFVYIATKGGPGDNSLMYVLYIYQHGFENLRMGYASALAWVLFIIVLAITLVQFKFSSRWVYYEGGTEGRA